MLPHLLTHFCDQIPDANNLRMGYSGSRSEGQQQASVIAGNIQNHSFYSYWKSDGFLLFPSSFTAEYQPMDGTCMELHTRGNKDENTVLTSK